MRFQPHLGRGADIHHPCGQEINNQSPVSVCGLLGRPEARGNVDRAQEAQMRAWNRHAFAAVASVFGPAWLSSIINNAQETNDYRIVSSP
jgi:hypothetical protein